MVRAVTFTEPEWDDEQRELVLAWREWEADRGPHGYSMREVTSPDADPNNREGTVLFKADALPIVDVAEQARALARKAYEENYPDANMAGLIFPVRRFEREPQKTPRRKHGG